MKMSTNVHMIINAKKNVIYVKNQNVQKQIVSIIVIKKQDIKKSIIATIFINVKKTAFLKIIQTIVKEDVY
jgi:hypothetical protein